MTESSPESTHEVPCSDREGPQQQHGDHTGAEKISDDPESAVGQTGGAREQLGKSPGEIAFFKLLHSEFKKATYFFDKAQAEFEIREERVREGMEIMKQPNSIMVNEKWSMLAKSIFKLYKDLLLLETYAIMAYCSFSKILKKHDKNVSQSECRLSMYGCPNTSGLVELANGRGPLKDFFRSLPM